MGRPLSTIEWLVPVPIGFLWMIVIVLVAVPVMIYMTLLYYAAQAVSAIFGRRGAPRRARPDREERVA